MTAQQAGENLYVLGETLKPMLTNDMGSSIEIFDTAGGAGGGPPTHKHAWEEIYVVTKGEMDVTVNGETQRFGPGGFAHVPANTPHSYQTLAANTEFLTIVTKGNASKFFRNVAKLQMNPPDIPGVIRVGAEHGIEFL
ncbi:MAG: cupin domain-containing protein [Alphaproteobacteria bacterium]